MRHPTLPLWARSLAGAGANVIVWSIMYPVDLVRSLQQSAATDAQPKSAIKLARALVAEGGVKRLYRGYTATAIRAGPVAGVLLLASAARAFYLPGVAPREYHEGEHVELKVNAACAAADD